MAVAEKSWLKENLHWNHTLIRMLRGDRTPAEFAALLGESEEIVCGWEALRARDRLEPNEEQTRRLRELAQTEGFLADWQLAGSMKLTGDLEEGSREIGEMFNCALEQSAHKLNE